MSESRSEQNATSPANRFLNFLVAQFEGFVEEHGVDPSDVRVDVVLSNGDEATFFGLDVEYAPQSPDYVILQHAASEDVGKLLIRAAHIHSAQFSLTPPPRPPYAFHPATSN